MSLLGLLFLFCFNHCSKHNAFKSESDNSGVNEIAKEEIRKIIKNNQFPTYGFDSIPNVISMYLFQNPQKKCMVIISISLGIDSAKFNGYIEIDDKPVAFYVLSDSCASNLVDIELLEKTKQYVSQKSFLFNIPQKPVIYEIPTVLYSVRNDSLIFESSYNLNMGFENIKYESE